MKIIKTCPCCGKTYTLSELTKIIETNVKLMYDANGNPCLYLFDCSCLSTLAVKVELIEVPK